MKNTYCVECGNMTAGVCSVCQYPVCWLCCGLHIEKEHSTVEAQTNEREKVMAQKNTNDDLTANGPWTSETISELKSRVDRAIQQAQNVKTASELDVYAGQEFVQGVGAEAAEILRILTGWGDSE